MPKLSENGAKKTTSSSQSLELSDELNNWINTFITSGTKESKGAVSMFNLLAFNPGLTSEYLYYGDAFSASIGAKHGGNAKIVGNVTHVNGSPTTRSSDSSVGMDGEVGGEWDEIALAHYPSVLHFREMLVSEEYQQVNKRHRVPSLRDTCILMTSEVAVEEMWEGRGGAKL